MSYTTKNKADGNQELSQPKQDNAEALFLDNRPSISKQLQLKNVMQNGPLSSERQITQTKITSSKVSQQKVIQAAKAGKLSDASHDAVVMRVVNYTSLKSFLEGPTGFAPGALIQLNLGTAPADIADTLNDLIANANLQSTTTFFHANSHGLLPNPPAWISRDVSPFIEFNVAKKSGADRIIYDVRNGNIYLSRHYNDFIRLVGAAGAANLEAVAFQNIGWLDEGVSPVTMAAAATANDLVNMFAAIAQGNPLP